MMWKKKIQRKIGILAFLFVLLSGITITARAEELPCRTAKAVGSYKDPTTGAIEDAGGSDNEALGQSMVSNVVDSTALIEEKTAGGYYVSLRFHLMDNISDVAFSVQAPGEDDWKQTEAEQTASQGEQADFRLPVETEDSVIRTECYVGAMGRNVIFYVTLTEFEEGNPGGFARMEKNMDALEGVTGLTVGGENSPAGEKKAVLEASDNSGDGKPQQLNLGASVWIMLFVTIFCADMLAGMALLGIRAWISGTMKERKLVYSEDEDDENEPEFPKLSGEDWEELKDDGKE